MTATRREKSERHRRLNQTAPADLDAPWMQPGRTSYQPSRAMGAGRLLLIAIVVIVGLAAFAIFAP
jgi:hypothetical protein